jgi:hypothetical protein
VTGTGGDVLFIEGASMAGKGGGPGADRAARRRDEGIGAHRADLRPQPRRADRHRGRRLRDREFHVHVPAGAIPKDGPSAGITMVTALASLLTGRTVKSTVGMTGEVTLQGRVLPIGGLKQKVLAAHAAGLTEVILPERNAPDLDDVPAEVRDRMTFHPVASIEQVLEIASRSQAGWRSPPDARHGLAGAHRAGPPFPDYSTASDGGRKTASGRPSHRCGRTRSIAGGREMILGRVRLHRLLDDSASREEPGVDRQVGRRVDDNPRQTSSVVLVWCLSLPRFHAQGCAADREAGPAGRLRQRSALMEGYDRAETPAPHRPRRSRSCGA